MLSLVPSDDRFLFITDSSVKDNDDNVHTLFSVIYKQVVFIYSIKENIIQQNSKNWNTTCHLCFTSITPFRS